MIAKKRKDNDGKEREMPSEALRRMWKDPNTSEAKENHM